MDRKIMIGAAAVVAVLVIGGAYFLLDTRETQEIEFAGVVLEEGAKLGLAVPDYVINDLGIESISDLNDHVNDFKGKIIGIDAGAGITEMTKEAIDKYELAGFEVTTSGESAMLASLDAAVDEGDPIVVTLWDPHWAMSAYNMVYLEDEENIYGEAESIESWARAGLLESDETLAKLMSQYSYDVNTFNGLLDFIEQSTEDVGKATKEWLSDNEELKSEWLDGIDVESDEDRGHIKIGYVNWACATGSSNVLKHLLEELGYSVSLERSDVGPMYTGLAYGDLDLTTTVWVPMTHKTYMNEYGPADWNK